MDKATLHEKLDAYLKGRLDAAEQAEVRQLIDSDKDVADQLELVRLEQELAEVLVDEKLDEMMKSWDEEEPSPNAVSDSSPKPNASKFPGKWTTWGFVIIVFIGLLIWSWSSGEESEALNAVTETPSSVPQLNETETLGDTPKKAESLQLPSQEINPAQGTSKQEPEATPPIANAQKTAAPSAEMQQLALAVAKTTSPIDGLEIIKRGAQADEPSLIKGYRLMGEGKLDEAKSALLTVTEARGRQYLNAQQYLAFIYFEKGEYEKSIPILENLTQQPYSQQAEMEWYLALSYLATENPKGLEALKQVVTESTSPEIQDKAQQLLDKINALD
jgi:tetratricopeptide (TPR) repeat protein